MPAARKTKKREGRGAEKRQQVRVPMENVTVEVYTPQGEAASPEVCDIVNLSIGGMLFRGGHPYDISQQVRLTFMPPESMVIVRTNAKVVHWHVSTDGKFVGVQFGSLGVSERMSIQNCVKRMQDN